MSQDRTDALLIALDWGTSSLRAYLLGDAGVILEHSSLPLGIMRLARSHLPTDRTLASAAFESAFEKACGSWLAKARSLPVLASGMVGSAQGWIEAPYLSVPVDLGELSKHLTPLTTSSGKLIYIVPGLIRKRELVNVMRGEESQILGAHSAFERAQSERLLIGLPGTHSKWANVTNRVVENFETFMTGEVFAALRERTILGQTRKQDAPFAVEAFERGAQVAMSPVGAMGLLSNIFSVRTLALAKQLAAQEQRDYLSGVLIGHEINAVSKLQKGPVLLTGEPSLCARYERVLQLYGFQSVTTITDAATRGLWQIAVEANLVFANKGCV